MILTHDNKQKFWFFYTKEDDGTYELYAFTDDKELANAFMESRCMERFYKKTEKLDRMNYNELIRSYMTCELEYFEGLCQLVSSECSKFKLPVTKREKQRILADESVMLHEKLYAHVWDNISILQTEYLEALWTLGYPALQSYIKFGDNPIHRTVEDGFIPNDMNFLLDVCGWSFVPEKRKSD